MNLIKITLVSFLSLFLLVSCGNTSHTEAELATDTTEEVQETVGIHFHEGTWSEALAKAKSENKLIFLDVSASWCGPCKMLKKKTFPDAMVGELFNTQFINVEVDGEVGEGISLAQQYNVEGYPSLFFINGDGAVVSKTMGFMPAEQFIKFGESVVKK